jgi:nucleoside-diphosphate-sugar epimerase
MKPEADRADLPCAPDQVDEFLSQPEAGVIETVARTPGPFVVLGAGGKMGLHLSMMLRKALRSSGRRDQVIAVSRFKSVNAREVFEAHGIATHDCDLMDLDALAALPDAPVVFYLAGVKFGTASAPELLHQANVVMPARVARRYRRSRIVAFSSGCVYPFMTPASGGATESTPVSPVGEYASSCVGREDAFAVAARQHGTQIALIRLNYAVEFRYGTLVDIAQKVFKGEPVDVTMGYFNAIWQPDAIAQSIRVIELAGNPAVALNVTGRQILSVRAVAQRFGEILGQPVKIIGHEAPTAWLNNPAYLQGLFGAPSTEVEQMVQWVAAWIKAEHRTWGKPTGFERRDGRF